MFNFPFIERYRCAGCGSSLEVKLMDELHNGEMEVYLISCSKCAARALPSALLNGEPSQAISALNGVNLSGTARVSKTLSDEDFRLLVESEVRELEAGNIDRFQFILSICGIANFNDATDHEKEMILSAVARVRL